MENVMDELNKLENFETLENSLIADYYPSPILKKLKHN